MNANIKQMKKTLGLFEEFLEKEMKLPISHDAFEFTSALKFRLRKLEEGEWNGKNNKFYFKSIS